MEVGAYLSFSEKYEATNVRSTDLSSYHCFWLCSIDKELYMSTDLTDKLSVSETLPLNPTSVTEVLYRIRRCKMC